VVAEALPDGRADVAEVGQQLLPDEIRQAGQVEVDVDRARRLGGRRIRLLLKRHARTPN
jgi:uncharacterized protein (UPF0262 family)